MRTETRERDGGLEVRDRASATGMPAGEAAERVARHPAARCTRRRLGVRPASSVVAGKIACSITSARAAVAPHSVRHPEERTATASVSGSR
jgi:hypothetical protein